MTALGIGPEARRRLSAPRIAEIVADELRRQIIDGELADGDLLPRQELLVEQFNVSLVSLREALRILETEGLVSVRRGNRGGAVVHAPAKTSAAYMLGMFLQSEYVRLGDLGMALQELEPTCAALAARRVDRADALVPELKQINEAMAAHLDDGGRFHRDRPTVSRSSRSRLRESHDDRRGGQPGDIVEQPRTTVGRASRPAGRVSVAVQAACRAEHSRSADRGDRGRRRALHGLFRPPQSRLRGRV